MNLVNGGTWYSCNKTHSGEKLIASVNGAIRPFPHGARTLDNTCRPIGEQSLFFILHFVSGVTVCGGVTPLTFDKSFRHIS